MRQEYDFMQEGMDLKRLFLCLRKRIMVILLCGLCGALLGGGVYLLLRSLVMETAWQTRSQFQMRFIYDPYLQTEQSYNGYTWNDLLHGDPVIDRIIEAMRDMGTAPVPSEVTGAAEDELTGGSGSRLLTEKQSEILKGWNAEQGSDDIRSLVREAIKGEIISDTRLLAVTVTAGDPDLAALLRQAVERGVLRYGAEQEEIVSMQLIRSAEPVLMIWDNRLPQAVWGGGFLFLAVAAFVWWFVYILDDSLYVIRDGEKRYPFPVLGLLVKEENDKESNKESKMETIQPYAGELAENALHVLKDAKKIAFVSVTAQADRVKTCHTASENKVNGDAANIASRAEAIFDRVMKAELGVNQWEIISMDGEFSAAAPKDNKTGTGVSADRSSRTVFRGAALRDTDGAVLVVNFGGRNGKQIDRTVSFLHNQDCPILGILITEGEERFWKNYYGSRK